VSRSSDDGRKIYLYCLTQNREGDPLHLTARGIGDQGSKVYTISFLDLAFVVSDSQDGEYESTRSNTMSHELVCEEVLKQSLTVLPVRFGTVAESTPGRSSAGEKIMKLSRRRYGEFESLLRDMEEKVELGLKAFWLQERLFQDILAENPDIRRMRDQLSGHATAGLSGHYGRLDLGTKVSEAIDVKRDVDAQKLARALAPLAERYEANKTLMDMMILNAAFLVHRSRVEEFDRKVDELDVTYGDRMKFKYVGEVPPFNFVEIVVHWEDED